MHACANDGDDDDDDDDDDDGGGDQEDKSKLGNSHSSLARSNHFCPFSVAFDSWFCQCCGTDQTSCQAACCRIGSVELHACHAQLAPFSDFIYRGFILSISLHRVWYKANCGYIMVRHRLQSGQNLLNCNKQSLHIQNSNLGTNLGS
jgi:hypothetical protein